MDILGGKRIHGHPVLNTLHLFYCLTTRYGMSPGLTDYESGHIVMQHIACVMWHSCLLIDVVMLVKNMVSFKLGNNLSFLSFFVSFFICFFGCREIGQFFAFCYLHLDYFAALHIVYFIYTTDVCL